MLRFLTAIIELITACIPKRTVIIYGEPTPPDDGFRILNGPSVGLRARRMLGGLVGTILFSAVAVARYPDFQQTGVPLLMRGCISFFALVFLWQLLNISETLGRRWFMEETP